MKHTPRLSRLLTLAGMLICLAARSGSAQNYVIRSVAPLSGGTGTAANAINASGQMACWGDVANGDIHAFRWGKASGSYGKLDLGNLGSSIETKAFGLN